MSKREWLLYITDMIGFAENVLSYCANMSQNEFETNGLTYDASLRNLELIGEAASHIPEQVRTTHTDIPWRMIIATRNRLIHGYLGIDNDTLWNIIEQDIPTLLVNLEKIKTAVSD